MTNQEIKTVGQTIAQETQIGGNTAARVGGVVEGIGVALDNKDAANGYYQATINGGTITVNAPNYLLGSGGNLRIKMPSAGTTASTLTIGNASAVQLWYNGKAVSSTNTWEANEIISVFYDGTRFMASNSQGGGGKAEKIKYDNSQSGLASDNVQGALDEVAGDVKLLHDSIGDVSASETPISMTWAQGTIQTVNGRETSSVKGLRTNKFILVSNDVKITTQEGYYIKRIYLYNTTGMSGDTPTDYIGVLYDGYSGGTWDSTVREFLVSKDNYLGKYIKVLVGNVTETEITVQESSNISLCYVTYGIGGETIAEKLQELDASTYVQRTIHPTLEYGRLSPSRGGLTEWSNTQGGTGTPYFSNSIRTSLFIDVSKNKSISVTTSIDCQFKVVYYYPNYTLLGNSGTEFIVATSGTPTTVEIPDGARYIKIFFQKGAISQNLYIPMFNLDIVGFFSEMYELKNIRNVDDGFQHLAVKVAKVNPSSAYGVSNTVQDELQYGIDHGILALPESYTNDGKPTRLIIYCHGAAVNYAGDGTRFDSTDLIPEYWLSEGYAIMDMDGELSSTDSQQHTYVPESIECYVAAYNWIIRNYNIYDDGILLGGRSQGGGMCFYIMQSVIPVIAACPLVPVCNWLWWWSYAPSSYKSYFATNAGFIGTQPTWSSNKKLTSSEINYLRSNFTAFRRYSPFWRMIVDLPTDAQVLIPNSYVGVLSTEEDEPEGLEELSRSLHARACCPVKFFDNDKDTIVPYKRNALLMYNMLINSAQDAEFRMFNIDNDVDMSKTAHHFELRTDRVITYTNSRGVTLQNVPIVYIEMLTFWRRYEQNM